MVARGHATPERTAPVREYKRVLLLVLIMTAVAVAIGGAAIMILYETAISEERQRLVDALNSQVRLIEAIARQEQRVEPLAARPWRKYSMRKPPGKN